MITTYRAAPDIDVLTSAFAIPGLGFVPINAFVLHGDEPVLVDTGAVVERDEFELSGLRAVLNYGHTFAHAFEAQYGGALSHG